MIVTRDLVNNSILSLHLEIDLVVADGQRNVKFMLCHSFATVMKGMFYESRVRYRVVYYKRCV